MSVDASLNDGVDSLDWLFSPKFQEYQIHFSPLL